MKTKIFFLVIFILMATGVSYSQMPNFEYVGGKIMMDTAYWNAGRDSYIKLFIERDNFRDTVKELLRKVKELKEELKRCKDEKAIYRKED